MTFKFHTYPAQVTFRENRQEILVKIYVVRKRVHLPGVFFEPYIPPQKYLYMCVREGAKEELRSVRGRWNTWEKQEVWSTWQW